MQAVSKFVTPRGWRPEAKCNQAAATNCGHGSAPRRSTSTRLVAVQMSANIPLKVRPRAVEGGGDEVVDDAAHDGGLAPAAWLSLPNEQVAGNDRRGQSLTRATPDDVFA